MDITCHFIKDGERSADLLPRMIGRVVTDLGLGLGIMTTSARHPNIRI